MKALLAFLVAAVVTAACGRLPDFPELPPEPALAEEDALLDQLLATMRRMKGALVVDPISNFELPRGNDDPVPDLRADTQLLEKLAIPDGDVGALLDRLMDVNDVRARWNLPSNLDQGYWVDHDDSFEKIRDVPGPARTNWVEEHAGACIPVRVSRPAVDAEHGLVLFYVESGGAGWIGLYKLQSGKLTRLKHVEVWIS